MSLERLRSGLSPEARRALAGTLGSKAAELLGAAGIDMQDYKSPEVLLDETRAKLEAFAQQLHPDHQSNPNDYDEWLAEWDVAWDEETNTPAIWHINAKTGEHDTEYLIDVRGLLLPGELPLPSEMRITELCCSHNKLTKLPELPDSLTEFDCSYNELTELPKLPYSLTGLYCAGNRFPAGYIEKIAETRPELTIDILPKQST